MKDETTSSFWNNNRADLLSKSALLFNSASAELFSLVKDIILKVVASYNLIG